MIYFGCNTDSNEPSFTELSLGKVHFIIELPTNILNEGDYKIYSFIGLLDDRMIYNRTTAPNIGISFSLVGLRGYSGLHSHKRKMQINPNIKWYKK